MATRLQSIPADREELKLLPEVDRSNAWKSGIRAAGASITAHLVLVAALLSLPPQTRRAVSEPDETLVSRQYTPLVAPPFELTQREPNRGKISKEVDLEALTPRPRIQVPALPPGRRTAQRQFSLPGETKETQRPTVVPAPPKIQAEESRVAQVAPPGGSRLLPAPPPQPPPEEKPKLAFEKPGAGGPGPSAPNVPLAVPGRSVDEAVRSVARSGGVGAGLIVGDVEGAGGIGEALSINPTRGRSGSNIELLSDPMGVDFRPYLIKVLSAVRRNWFAVIPESAKFGRRGKVIIQFAISREGDVPKLVIAVPSGADALDRAAVAGISASNPFPPLPAKYRGDQVRLQLSFFYNMSRN
ncbi:MAG: TonB C-terminal domain-containing protein [Bryobacterales bacterium]|nr:TonB C-terminal domain-containing protein [Bryobacterales bacterium]